MLPVEAEIRIQDWLYGAGVGDVLARLREVNEGVGSVLVVGHNPTLHELALALTGREDALERFPTGALASVAFAVPWVDLAEGTAKLEAFVIPREL